MIDDRPGALLRRYRQQRRLTLERAGERADVDHTLLSRIERGLRRLTPETLGAIAEGWPLTPVERDRLALAAGLAPVDPLSLLIHEPAVAALYRYLCDPAVPAADRLRVREIVALLVATVAPAQTEQAA